MSFDLVCGREQGQKFHPAGQLQMERNNTAIRTLSLRAEFTSRFDSAFRMKIKNWNISENLEHFVGVERTLYSLNSGEVQ